nr:putative ribonuclease H-like domain-containing protein [Tanacetum cinerariifolium]
MAGSDNDSNDASVHNEATNTQQQPNIQPQIITTISNNNTKFPYLKKDEYEVWAMKMEYWITHNDMNIWKMIQNGNNMKRTGRDHDGNVIILPPTTVKEHIAVQRESKARTTLLQSIPDDHVANFHYMDDARDIWNAIKSRFGSNAESKKIRKSMLKQEFSEFRIDEAEGLHNGKIDFDKKESARFNKKNVRCYKCQQRGHFARECRAKGGNDKQKYSSFKIKEIGKTEEDLKALIIVDTLVDWVNHDSESVGVIAAQEFGMIDGCDSKDAIKKGSTKLYNLITGANSEEANTAGAGGEFALMGVTSERVLQQNQLSLEDKIRVLSIELENTSNLLKHSKRINADYETAKRDLQTKLDNHLVQTEKWRNSFKNLFKLIDSSMSVGTKVGLGFTNCIRESELGWDDFAFSVFTTNSEDVEGRPIFHRFSKTNSMKAVPPPLSRDYTSLSDHIDLDELKMSYGTNSSTFCDSKSVSNDFVSCDDSEKSSEVNTNDFASSNSSVKSSEHKPTDSTSCASTSSVSTSVNEATFESNVGTPIKEPIIVLDFSSFTCNSSDKNEYTSRTSCNQNVPTGKLKVTPVPTGKPTVTLVPTGKPKVTPVPTGKQQVSTPVPTGRLNRPFLVPTDRGYSLLLFSGQMLLSPHRVILGKHIDKDNHFLTTEDEGIFDSGCSRSMTGNKDRLDDFQAFPGRKVTFGGGERRITRKGTIYTPTLDFENVYYVKELQKFNMFSISQICDKKNQVLFTDTECLVLSKDFKLPDDGMVVLKVLRKHNLYTINLNDLCHRGNLACLVAYSSFDECVKWHRRMAHVNYKNMNRLVKGNLVRGLPPKLFKNGHTCVACYKGKQHKASYKAINAVSSIFKPLQLLHMDLFGPTSIRSIDHKYYCLVITDVYSRFCWVFFLAHKYETYHILKDFINLVENQLNKKREYSNPRTPLQNGVAERKNRTLIEAAQTMLADSKLPTMFWTEAMKATLLVIPQVIKPTGSNQSADTQGAITISAGTPDNVSDSGCDEQIIIVPSYPSFNVQQSEPKDTSGDTVDDSPFQSADENFQTELARLKDQEQRVTSDAEELRTPAGAKAVLPGCISVPTGSVTVPTGSVPVPTGSILVPAGDTMVPTDDVPVHTSSLTNSMFDGFVDPQHPKKVYKVFKALYGHHQAPRAWYATLSTFLLKKGYKRGTIDKTLFLKKNNCDIILVQVYVDDIIFGSTKKAWCDEFKALMKGEFQMSAMGELTFFLGLQVQQRPNGIFIYQDKYVQEILNKFDLGNVRTVTTPYEAPKPKSKSGSDNPVNYKAEHNKVGYLLKPTRRDECHKIIDFLRSSHIKYALSTNPTIFDSLVKQFLSTTTLRAPELGPPAILATIDRTPYTITEELVRSRLQLADDGGVADLPILKIYSGMDNLGYVTEGKLTFFKNKFSPQWRFLVHTLLHCLSTNSKSWDQFGSPIAIALICLSDGRRFNWSNNIFRGMVSNIRNARKFLMYPRFLQTILAIETRVARQYKVLVFSSKIFANIRLNFAGNPMPLLPAMLLQAQAGEGVEVDAQDVSHHMPAPDQSPAHLPTPSRPHTSDPVAHVLKQGHSFDPHKTASGPFLTMADAPLGGDFPTSPSRSSPAPPTGQPSGGEEDPITLTTLSSIVSTLVNKVHSLEIELHDHKKLFKEGKLVKKVKTLGVKLKTQKGKLVVSDSDQEDGDTPHVDLDALRTLANVAVAIDSDILSAVAPGASDVPSGTSVVLAVALTVPASSLTVPAAVTSSGIPAGVSSKGKCLMVEEDILVSARTPKQMEEDRLEFEKIRKVQSHSQIQAFGRTLKRPGPVFNEPSSKRSKSPEASTPSMPEVPSSPAVSSPPSSRIRRKSLGRKYILKSKSLLSKLDLDTEAQSFINVVVNEEFDDEVTPAWSAVVGWEVLPTPLGEINALYRIDGSTKHFTTLRQILHMVDQQDLVKLYGLVVQYYETHPAAGVGLILWGDLQVLFDSHAVGKDVSYPLSVKLMEEILMHKLEIDSDIVGNDLTTVEQLIQFIKNQLVTAQASSV